MLLRTSAAKAGKIGLLVVSAPCFAPHSSRSAPFRSSSSRGFNSSSSRSRPAPPRSSSSQYSALAKVRPAVALSFARIGFARSSLSIIISALGRSLPLSFLVRSLLPRAATPHYPPPRSSGAVVRLPQHGFGLVATGARVRTERAQSPHGYNVPTKTARAFQRATKGDFDWNIIGFID